MLTQKTASQAILEQLASEQRRILSGWRALILLRRATLNLAARQRRWSELPHGVTDLYPLLRQMQQRGELAPLPDIRRLYEVTVPYARTGPIAEEEVVMEVDPYAALSHISAMVFHGLTDDLPRSITVMTPFDGRGDQLPLDTQPRDWEGIPLVSGRHPAKVLGHPVQWIKVKPENFFGLAVYQPRGYAVRVTNVERTLLDGLLAPERCGGIANVLRAWAFARDTLDLDVVVSQVDRFRIAVLRQRVGFVLDELGLPHPALETWRTQTHRGGSSRLVASAPYAPQFSERWNLSLNASVTALREAAL